MQHPHEELREFQQAALLELGESGRVIRGIGALKPVFRYQILPSFDVPVAYFLSDRKEPLNGYRYYGIKATWRSDLDYARLIPKMSPPTIELLWVKIDDDFATQLNEAIGAIEVKVSVSHHLQLDGTGHEIAFGHASFTWGEHAPTEWTQLASVGEALALHIDELLQI